MSKLMILILLLKKMWGGGFPKRELTFNLEILERGEVDFQDKKYLQAYGEDRLSTKASHGKETNFLK